MGDGDGNEAGRQQRGKRARAARAMVTLMRVTRKEEGKGSKVM